MSRGEVFSIYAVVSGDETSGTLVLASDLWMLSATSGFINKIRLPFGSKMKIWESKLASDRYCLVNVETAHYGNSSYETEFRSVGFDFVSGINSNNGELVISREGRPLVIPGADEKWVAFRFTTLSSTGITAQAEYNVEITPNE